MQRIVSFPVYFTLTFMIVSCIKCESYYTIFAPEHIRPHLDYQISITLHNYIEPATIRLSIKDFFKYKNEKEVTVNSNQTELVSLRIDALNLTNGYKFIAQGLSGIIFKNEYDLRIESKNVSIFIQTDKAIYKPGETVKFRVLVLDYELKPVTLTADNLLSIYLTDPEKNRIKQWLNVPPKKGVFTSEVQLSELPVLGNWKFEAKVGKETKTKEIEVAEYVLPKFEVSIDSPNDFSAKDGKIRAIVRSKYTYGKLVKGEATVSLQSVTKTIPIDGKGTVEFDADKDWFTSSVHERNFDLKATVIEGLTGRNRSTSKTITIHEARYKICKTSLKDAFEPGHPVTFEIGVSRYDNSPLLINNATKSIVVEKELIPVYDWLEDHEKYEPINKWNNFFNFELNGNGTVSIEIPTTEKAGPFRLKLKYMNEDTDLGSFYPYEATEVSSDLELKILTERPTLNGNIAVEVKSKNVLQNVTYQVISHRKVVSAETLIVPNQKTHVFKFKATGDLFPKATIIVYYFKKNDTIVGKSIDLTIDEDMNNFVKLKLSSRETQPGKDIQIEVITNPDSYVGLVGVDQSVLLMKENDGLTKNDVTNELDDYQRHFYSKVNPWPFGSINIILFTNAKQDNYIPRMHWQNYNLEEDYPFSDSDNCENAWCSDASEYDMGFGLIDIRLEEELDSDLTINKHFDNQMAPSPISNAREPPRVRTEFPETWLWEDFDVNNPNGTLTLTKKVPDTITSWVISAISVNSKTGLGLTKSPKSIKVFQPFFVSLSLPYSVKRGEVVAVPVILFNYLNTDVNAELTLHNEDGEFEFIDDIEGDETLRKRNVFIPSDGGVPSTFLVRFTSIGQIPLKVTATSAIAGDATVHILQIDPEGVPQYVNKALFVDLRTTDTFEHTLNIDVPENAVSASLRINVNAIGDLLGGTIQNLDQLIRLPTGCGEQNMLKFVPDIVVLDYLTAIDSLDVSIKEKALKYLETGYQRELSYRHDDGSFSVFGKSDGKGSTWLTAFVVKAFKQAEIYIDIDSHLIAKALDFLSTTQTTSGTFPEGGRIYDHAMQGGSSNGVALTAYVTIAFLTNKESNNWKHQDTVKKAIDNIILNIEGIENPYAEAIAAYVLQLADHPTKNEVLEKFISKSLDSGQQKYWSSSKPGSNDHQSISIDIEITSYGVLALIEAKRSTIEILPYIKWLLAQRNDKGGFFGTQDTVIGLEALALYSRTLSSRNNNIQLKIKTEAVEERIMHVKSNSLVLQTINLPSDTKSVHLSASGHGIALFQLSYRYNVNKNDSFTTFNLYPKVLENSSGHVKVEVCSRFNAKNDEVKHSNMVILEVAMPSGFLLDKDQLDELSNESHVKLVETKRGETVTDIYIDQMLANEDVCLTVHGYRSHEVAENKPVPVRIYDYYDSSRSAREFYEIPMITACDICTRDDCSSSCKK